MSSSKPRHLFPSTCKMIASLGSKWYPKPSDPFHQAHPWFALVSWPGANCGGNKWRSVGSRTVSSNQNYIHIYTAKNNRDHLQNQDSTDFYSMSRQSLGNTKVLCLWRRLAWCRSWDLHRASAGERYTDNSWKPKNGQESKSEYQKRKPSGCPGVSHWLKPWWQAISWYSLDDKRMCFMPGWLHTFCWETNRN